MLECRSVSCWHDEGGKKYCCRLQSTSHKIMDKSDITCRVDIDQTPFHLVNLHDPHGGAHGM